MNMDSPDPQEQQELEQRLTNIGARLRGFHAIKDIDARPLLNLIPEWEKEIQVIRRLNEREPIPEPLAIQQLVDPRYLESLLVFRETSTSGGAYLWPVIAAWTFLAGAEWQYAKYLSQLSDEKSYKEIGFFGWWTLQPLGPWIYSALIAGLLACIMIWQSRSTRKAAARIDLWTSQIAVDAAVISTEVAKLLRRSPAMTRDSAANNTRAAQELLRAAEELRGILGPLANKSGSIEKQLAATRQANDAVDSLAGVCRSLETQAASLNKVIEALDPALENWGDKTQPIVAVLERITTENESLAKSSQTLSQSTAGWLSQLEGITEVVRGVSSSKQTLETAQAAMTTTAAKLVSAADSLVKAADGAVKQSSGFEEASKQLRAALLDLDALSFNGHVRAR